MSSKKNQQTGGHREEWTPDMIYVKHIMESRLKHLEHKIYNIVPQVLDRCSQLYAAAMARSCDLPKTVPIKDVNIQTNMPDVKAMGDSLSLSLKESSVQTKPTASKTKGCSASPALQHAHIQTETTYFKKICARSLIESMVPVRDSGRIRPPRWTPSKTPIPIAQLSRIQKTMKVMKMPKEQREMHQKMQEVPGDKEPKAVEGLPEPCNKLAVPKDVMNLPNTLAELLELAKLSEFPEVPDLSELSELLELPEVTEVPAMFSDVLSEPNYMELPEQDIQQLSGVSDAPKKQNEKHEVSMVPVVSVLPTARSLPEISELILLDSACQKGADNAETVSLE